MRTFPSATVTAVIAITAAAWALPAAAQTAAAPVYPATLAGHAILSAQSFIAAPKDAPLDL